MLCALCVRTAASCRTLCTLAAAAHHVLTKHTPPLPAPAGPPLPDLSSLPADFDWQTYVGINPDLAQAGIITQTAGELAQTPGLPGGVAGC